MDEHSISNFADSNFTKHTSVSQTFLSTLQVNFVQVLDEVIKPPIELRAVLDLVLDSNPAMDQGLYMQLMRWH